MSYDVLSPEQRSYCMSQIKGKNTKSEIILRRALWNLGYRYRIKNKLPGKPDLVFSSYKIVIFIDGCFWHKCPYHFIQPKTRTEFWLNKISSNVARDLRNNEMLKAQGWLVIRVWEHDIKKSLENTVTNIVDALQKRKDSIHVKSY